MSNHKPLNISIIDFFESEAILGIKTLSPTQKVILKAINGEILDDKTPIPKSHDYQDRDFDSEVDLFLFLTGKDEYIPGHKYTDMSLAAGRRGGKSNIIAAGCVCYYATQKDYSPYMGTSPFATIPIISPTKEQANEVYQAVKNFFLKSPYLFQQFLDGKITSFQEEYDENDTEKKVFVGGNIRLNNKVVIKTMAADVSRIRGFAVPLYVLDEACWFGVDGSDSKNTDKAINEAIQPATAQFGELAFGIKISSPNGESGLMYDDYQNRKDPDVLHIQAPTWYMNPNITVAYLRKQKKKGEHYYNREYGAQYVASENAYLDPALVDLAELIGIEKIDYQPGMHYAAAMDYATKHDYWTLAIGHKEYHLVDVNINGNIVKEKVEKVYIDFLYHWQGQQGAELDPAEVVIEISKYLKEYRVPYILTDQYAHAALKSLFQLHNQNAKEHATSEQSKKKYMASLQVAVNSKSLNYVTNKVAKKHMKDLREKRLSSGKIKIEHAAGCHDDYADSIGLVVYQFDKTSPVYIGHTKDDETVTAETKDKAGKYIATPTASQVAQDAGITQFQDNSSEYDEHGNKIVREEDDDPGNFWFLF